MDQIWDSHKELKIKYFLNIPTPYPFYEHFIERRVIEWQILIKFKQIDSFFLDKNSIFIKTTSENNISNVENSVGLEIEQLNKILLNLPLGTPNDKQDQNIVPKRKKRKRPRIHRKSSQKTKKSANLPGNFNEKLKNFDHLFNVEYLIKCRILMRK